VHQTAIIPHPAVQRLADLRSTQTPFGCCDRVRRITNKPARSSSVQHSALDRPGQLGLANKTVLASSGFPVYDNQLNNHNNSSWLKTKLARISGPVDFAVLYPSSLKIWGVGRLRSPQSHSSLCSCGFVQLPPTQIFKDFGYSYLAVA
jgi:hypothetical protein